MLAELLQKQWRESARFRPVHSSMSLEPNGLVLGCGTVLAPAVSDGTRRVALGESEARLLTLLSLAYGHPVSPTVLRHIRKAAERWSEGEDCLAAIHLAFARLPKLDDPRAAAKRLFLTDGLIAAGETLSDVLAAFGQIAPDSYRKLYDENETRMPKGNGEISGEWSTDGTGARSFLEPLPKLDVLALARFAARFGGPIIALGALIIPTPAGGRRIEGQIPGDLDLRYAWNQDETRLLITQGTGKIVLTADLWPDGLFRDDRHQVIGRALGDHVVLDADAVRAELPKNATEDEDPKLCPVPNRDKAGRTSLAGEKDRDYEDFVKRLVNPDNPTPRGFGVQLPNPEGGPPVYYDDCQRRSGILIEAKGTGYAEPIERSPFMTKVFDAQWVAQAKRQIAASQGRPIEWHFAERGAAEHARALFANTEGLEEINVVYTPWSEHDE